MCRIKCFAHFIIDNLIIQLVSMYVNKIFTTIRINKIILRYKNSAWDNEPA